MENENTQQVESKNHNEESSIWDSDFSMGFEMTPEVWLREQ